MLSGKTPVSQAPERNSGGKAPRPTVFAASSNQAVVQPPVAEPVANGTAEGAASKPILPPPVGPDHPKYESEQKAIRKCEEMTMRSFGTCPLITKLIAAMAAQGCEVKNRALLQCGNCETIGDVAGGFVAEEGVSVGSFRLALLVLVCARCLFILPHKSSAFLPALSVCV
jgi:hypothetical protein